MGNAAIAVASGAGVLKAAFAVAARAGEIELHIARHLGYIAGAVALRTGDGAGFVAASAMAGGALFVAGDFDLGLRAADGLPEAMFSPYSRSAPFSGSASGRLAGGDRRGRTD